MCSSSAPLWTLIFAHGSSVIASNTSSSPTAGVICGGYRVVSASQIGASWLWSFDAPSAPSCTDPPVENFAEMCEGDPTSVVIRGSGQPQCLGAHMPDCKFNMRNLEQLDFDVNMVGCGGTWAAPLWMTPDYWGFSGPSSGEIDMMENCPSDRVQNNFAGGGNEVRVAIADPNSFQGHTTLWKQADGDGIMSIHVKTCDPSEMLDGSCLEEGDVAYYRDIYGASGCRDGANCMYTLISDIWNGNAGDAGYQSCSGGQPHYSSGCQVSVGNIRIKAAPGTFSGKCEHLIAQPMPSPSPPPSPSPSPWQPCTHDACCNPHSVPIQYCPGGQACRECGGGDSCQCPGQALSFEIV